MDSRVIEFEGISNVRDLGGLKNSEGKTVRKGCLIRSANLAEATDNDLIKLQEMGLQKVVDLRSIRETNDSADRVPENTEYINNYIFPERRDGISHEKGEDEEMDISKIDMANTYAFLMNEDICVRNFGTAVKHIMNTDFDNGPALWHCSEGKDRCGLVSAFLLTILGVDEETIMEDYLMTNIVNEPKAEYLYDMFKKMGRSEADCEGIRNVILAKRSYMEKARERILEKYGSMENFLTEGLQLSEEEMNEFRKKMLV